MRSIVTLAISSRTQSSRISSRSRGDGRSTGEIALSSDKFVLIADKAEIISSRRKMLVPLPPNMVRADLVQLLEAVYEAPPCLPKLQVRLLHLQYALLSPTHGSRSLWSLLSDRRVR